MASENLGAIREQFITLNKKRTNADKLRAMSDEELAEWIVTVPLSHDDICPSPHPERCDGSNGYDVEACKQCWLDWMQKEASE